MSPFCQNAHRTFALGSMISEMLVMFKSTISLSLPYIGKDGVRGELGAPLMAKLVM